MKNQSSDIRSLTPDQESKAELTLIAQAHRKNRQERQAFCKDLGVSWAEYQRLLRKWSRVVERWDKWKEEKGEKCPTITKI